LVLLGGVAPSALSAAGLGSVGSVAFGIGILGGVVLWGYGLWWLGLAVLKIAYYLREGLPFNLGWWGFTFPVAVYTLASLALGRTTHFLPFTVAGGLLTIALAALWIVVAMRTARGAWRRDLFLAPCLTQVRLVARFEADAV
jgi:tellurite resistance protein TehA-like permease